MLCRVLVLIAVLALVVEGAPRPARRPRKLVDSNESKALDYLEKYGYLEGKNVITKMAVTDKKSAILKFQKMAGLKATGLLDPETLKMMDRPRCGLADTNQTRKYVAVNRWPKKDLTYTISKYPASTLNPQQVDQEIARAFQVWSDVTDLTFRVVDRRRDQKPDIHIRFETGNHGDGSSFDGNGGTLAHAFFPTDGKTHFDDTEHWTMHQSSGINLFQVAAHEFGHSLGLDHSEVSSALMAPFYQSYQPNFRLHNDDTQGIQRLYGRKTNQGAPAPPPPQPTPPPPPPAPPVRPGWPNHGWPHPGGPHPGWPHHPGWPTDPSLCQDLTFDTIFTDLQGVTYVIKGTQYWVLGSNTPPRDVQRKWAGVPPRIDAAFSHRDIGKTYFFSGAMVWRYDGDQLDRGYPARISERFPGIPDDLDTAFVWSRNNQMYFFKGREYWKFDYTKWPAVEPTYPRQISTEWRVVPDSPDAAFSYNGVTYFAKGTSYSGFLDSSLSLDSIGYRSIEILFGCSNNNRMTISAKDKTWIAGLKNKRRIPIPTKSNTSRASLTKNGRIPISTESKTRNAELKNKTQEKKPNTVLRSLSHLTELRKPDHKVCSKHHTCKNYP